MGIILLIDNVFHVTNSDRKSEVEGLLPVSSAIKKGLSNKGTFTLYFTLDPGMVYELPQSYVGYIMIGDRSNIYHGFFQWGYAQLFEINNVNIGIKKDSEAKLNIYRVESVKTVLQNNTGDTLNLFISVSMHNLY